MIVAQKPTQSIAAPHRPLALPIVCPRKQQDVTLPLMIPLGMEMVDIVAQCPPQRALAEEDHYGQAHLLDRPERLLTPPNGPEISFSDMTMMIMTGGRERTREEFSELFSAAGFHLEQVVVTKSPFTLMVGAPV